MQDILDASRDIGRRIAESGCYADYSEALEGLRKDPGLTGRVTEFKRVQAGYAGGEMTLDREKHLSKLYFDLCLNPAAERFLKAEKKMLALMLGVNENIWSGCNIEILTGEGL